MAAHKLKNDWLIDFDYNAEEERITQIIKNDKKWLASVEEKSIRCNQTLEKTIRDDAVWTVNKKMKRKE